MKTARIASLLLALLMLTLTFAACSTEGQGGDGTTAAPAVVTTAPAGEATTASNVDENGYLLDDLPELNYGDKDFTIYTWNNQVQWEWSEDEGTTGDTIKDAIYTRQLRTEERMGIKLVIQGEPGEWDHRNTFIDSVYNSVSSGTVAYDAIGQYTPAAAIGAMRNCYVDLKDVKNLDLAKPWWPDDIIESSVVAKKLYFTTGDITATLARGVQCILTNLSLADDLKLPNMYELVDNHEWTMEKFMELGTGTVMGLNPDGSNCYSTTIANNVIYDNLFYSGGFRFVDITPEGDLVLSEDLDSQKMVDWYATCRSLLFDNKDVELLAVNGANGFTTGNVLFHFGAISDVQNYLQDVSFDFGILPYPMYDKNQEDYHTICGYWVTLYSIPTNAADTDMSGAVLECLGSYGYRLITPAVYEVSFKYRFLNTPENAKVFDLLHDSLVFDTGRNFADQINCFAAFRQAAGTTYDNWSAYFKTNKILWTKNIQKIVDNLG